MPFLEARSRPGQQLADPPTLESTVPNWGPGDTIHLGKRTLRVIGKRDDDGDQPPVLVVEEA